MANKRVLKTVIVEDNKEFREALNLVCDLYDEIEVIGECENGQEFINYLNTEVPDLVFMDIKMPKLDGIETTKQAIKAFPQLKIIALSFHNQFEYIEQMMFAGAYNYIIKDELTNNRIQQILDGIINIKKTIKN